VSDWSDPSIFTTIDSSGDANTNGIPDAQEVDESVDVNENGIADYFEDNIMTVNTVEGQSIVGVEVISEMSLVSIKSMSHRYIADQSVKMGFGLVGFKLYLQDGVRTATVTIHFSSLCPRMPNYINTSPIPVGRHTTNAVFAPNRKSVTLILEDGGMGDEDGIENGVIVDPSGISYTSSVTSDSASVSTGAAATEGGGGGCFISAGNQDLIAHGSIFYSAVILVIMLAMGIVFAARCQVNNNK
jgi:chitinase